MLVSGVQRRGIPSSGVDTSSTDTQRTLPGPSRDSFHERSDRVWMHACAPDGAAPDIERHYIPAANARSTPKSLTAPEPVQLIIPPAVNGPTAGVRLHRWYGCRDAGKYLRQTSTAQRRPRIRERVARVADFNAVR
jgi:hypothetical protein